LFSLTALVGNYYIYFSLRTISFNQLIGAAPIAPPPPDFFVAPPQPTNSIGAPPMKELRRHRVLV